MENRLGEGKNSVGNVEARELISMTHGHDLKAGNASGKGYAGQRGIKEGKWDNCNSIINKIYIYILNLLYDPVISLLDSCPKRNENIHPHETYTRIYTMALFIGQTRTQPKCPSAAESVVYL